MLHANCGKQPKNTIDANIKSKILDIYRLPQFEECNFHHFKEILEGLYDIKISYSPLYKLLVDNGFKSHRKHKKVKNHNRRKKRSSEGELLQVDAIPHPFFYGDDTPYSLHGFIDDATGKFTGLFM